MLYKERFNNLLRVATNLTSSLHIGDILEMIRNEAKHASSHVQEACLLILDEEASAYTRPLHCAVHRDRINCQLCKRGRETIERALKAPGSSGQPLAAGDVPLQPENKPADDLAEVAFPIYEGQRPLAVLDIIAKRGQGLDQKDLVLFKDLVSLANRALINARTHWKISQEKLSLDSMLGHLKPFVPETVKKIVAKDPSAPFLGKQEVDVSVLFLDIAGYTKISESLSKEQTNFTIEKYFSSFLDIIHEQGGDINETAGDGLMVIFQGPGTQNALSAARAALAIRQKAAAINQELQGRFQPIQVNMGINSGAALLGITRFKGATGERMTYTASGETTNLAARIAAAAKDGDILVGPQTAARIEGRLPFRDLGTMQFKNVSQYTRVFSLLD